MKSGWALRNSGLDWVGLTSKKFPKVGLIKKITYLINLNEPILKPISGWVVPSGSKIGSSRVGLPIGPQGLEFGSNFGFVGRVHLATYFHFISIAWKIDKTSTWSMFYQLCRMFMGVENGNIRLCFRCLLASNATCCILLLLLSRADGTAHRGRKGIFVSFSKMIFWIIFKNDFKIKCL